MSFTSLLLVSVLLHALLWPTGGAVITSPPQNATTLFDDTAVFNCAGEGHLLQWTYDGTTVDGQIAQQYQISIVHHNVSDGMVSSSLYINATIDNDGAVITCLIIDFGGPILISSAEAVLTVIGIGAVRDATVLLTSNDTVLNISWCPPNLVPPNIDALKYETTVLTHDTTTVITTTDTYLLYSIQHCTLYNITIATVGSQGQDAHYSDPVSLSEYIGEYIISITSISVSITSTVKVTGTIAVSL